MKHLLSLLAAAILITAAYLYQFGLPAFFSSEGDATNVAQPAAKQGAAPQGPPPPPGQGPGGRRGQAGATYVTVADVVVRPYTESFNAVGTGIAQTRVSLVSEVAGQIREVFFDGTQQVAKGDILIQLEDDSERINVDIAKANLDKAMDSLERYKSLQQRQSGLVSAVSMKEAEAAVAVAEGNLALAEVTLRDRAIYAPINGKLGLTDLESGDYLSNGAKIVDINNTEILLVSFELPERAVSILELGKKVRLTTPAKVGLLFEGKITAFDSVIDETTRTVTVKAAIDNKKGLLWPGMTFNASLTEISAPLAAIPAMALTWTRDGTKVWVYDNGTVQPLTVTYRQRQDDTIWVEGDLKEGVKVVVDGVHKLRPGAKVTVAEEIETDTPPVTPPLSDDSKDATQAPAKPMEPAQ